MAQIELAQATHDVFVGPVTNGLNSSGVFYAGSCTVMDHRQINGIPFVFSAAVPALLTVSASEGINILRNTPSILSLQENVRAIRAVLDLIDAVKIASHAASPIAHIQLHFATPSASALVKPVKPATPAPRDALSSDIAEEGRLLQDTVDEMLA